jgi:hypothetical protein
MTKTLSCAILLLVLGLAAPASAELFALEAQGQGGFSQIGELQLPGASETVSFSGAAFGARARVQVLFLNAMLDYQYFIKKANLLHLGVGFYVSTDLLPVITPYAQASVGLMLFNAKAEALGVAEDLTTEAGFQARGGGGIEIRFAGDFLAIGASGDIAFHYLTGKPGYDFSVMGYLGLRI